MKTEKLIEKLEKLSGKKIKLTESLNHNAATVISEIPKLGVKTKVIYGTIAGGRAGTRYSSKIVEMDLSTFATFRASYEELTESDDYIESPNGEEDYKEIYKALVIRTAVAVSDSFGEGIVGFGFDPKDVKLAVLEKFNDEEDGY